MEAAMEEVEPEAIVVFMSLNYIAKIGISKQKLNFEDFFLHLKKKYSGDEPSFKI